MRFHHRGASRRCLPHGFAERFSKSATALVTPRHVLGDRRLATSMPSFGSSPWIRGAPHSRLARLISRIGRRISPGIVGRPPRGRDFQRQYSWNPIRCHRMTVSGWTIVRAFIADGNGRQSQTKSSRSATVSLECARWRSTLNWCRSRTISASSRARVLNGEIRTWRNRIRNLIIVHRLADHAAHASRDEVLGMDSHFSVRCRISCKPLGRRRGSEPAKLRC